MNRTELSKFCAEHEGDKIISRLLWEFVYSRRDGRLLPNSWNEWEPFARRHGLSAVKLSKWCASFLEQELPILSLHELQSQIASDGTHKILWKVDPKVPDRPGAESIESVLIPRGDRLTLCISSQVGCAMACSFCLTGKQGLTRHLSPAEVIAQVTTLSQRFAITNIVFMGMGEPLHNIDAVIQACNTLRDSEGLAFSYRRIQVSTSGLVPAIDRLGRETQVTLAISLNSSFDAQRTAIMPVNRKWPIAQLLDACRRYPSTTSRPINFEYVLLKGYNDSLEDAARVAELLNGVHGKVNLIPFNPHPGSDFERPLEQDIKAFQNHLIHAQIPATIRKSRGPDILAACGQLRSDTKPL